MSIDGNFACGIHPSAQIAIGEQQWVTGFSLCVKCCRMVGSVPRWRLSPTNWPIQSIADYDDTAFGAETLTCTFLESRFMTVENLFIYSTSTLLRDA